VALLDSAPQSIIDDALAELRGVLDTLEQRLCDGVEALEYTLRNTLNAVGRAAMTTALEHCDPQPKRLPDGRTRVLETTHRYMTLFGPVTPKRGRYRAKRTGPSDCPMEQRADIVAGFWTPLAAKAALIAVAELPPRRVIALFKVLLGPGPSRSALDRLPKQFLTAFQAQQPHLEAHLRDADRLPDATATVLGSLDGVMLTLRSSQRRDRKQAARARNQQDSGPIGQREAMCAAVSAYDSAGRRLKTIRWGQMPEAGRSGIQAWLRAELAAVRQASQPVSVMVGADGSSSLWHFLSSVESDVECVDFYHASAYLKDALDDLMGAGHSGTDQRYVELRHTLRHERFGVEKVSSELQRLEAAQVRPKPRQKGSRFFVQHHDRMSYAELSGQDWPIGTGVMEGTCKSLVSDRMKRSGMRWGQVGGQAILTLRSLVQSERFETCWHWMIQHKAMAA